MLQAISWSDLMLKGTGYGRPMQLDVVGEGGMASQPSSDRAEVSKGKQCELRRSEICLPILFVYNKQLTASVFFSLSAPSFYPGYGGAASILDPEAAQFFNSTFEDPPDENEEDWIDNQEMILTQGLPSKMAETMALEVHGCISCATLF
jgi:hypothetical protein